MTQALYRCSAAAHVRHIYEADKHAPDSVRVREFCCWPASSGLLLCTLLRRQGLAKDVAMPSPELSLALLGVSLGIGWGSLGITLEALLLLAGESFHGARFHLQF